ncbi:MAG: hypothetical protein KDD40_12450, partial [Bdellovibrionales bacterium]|nr:hypothetical protein [Bdellovibrionales bacterium]
MQLDKRVYEFEKKHHRTPTPQELKQIYHDVGLSEQAIPKLSSIYVNGDSEDEDRNLLNNLQTPRNSAEEAMRFTQSQEKIIFILSQLKKIEKIKYLIDTYIIHVTAKLNSSHSAKQKIELNGKEVFVGYGTQQHLAFLFGVSQQAINSRIKRVQKMIMWAMETPGLNKENFVKKLTENFELK